MYVRGRSYARDLHIRGHEKIDTGKIIVLLEMHVRGRSYARDHHIRGHEKIDTSKIIVLHDVGEVRVLISNLIKY